MSFDRLKYIKDPAICEQEWEDIKQDEQRYEAMEMAQEEREQEEADSKRFGSRVVGYDNE